MSFDKEEAIVKAKEFLVKGLVGIDTLSRVGVARYHRLKESNQDLDEHCGIALGVILTLFGGQYATTFAFVEAFQQSGYKDLAENCRLIQEQLGHASQAVVADDSVDDNGDGIADVQQINARALAERKFEVFIKHVDPEVVKRALGALWLSFLSASAAVKLKFAKVIALGAAVGEFIEKPAQKYLEPRLRLVLDPKYHRWLPSLVSYLCRAIGISIAFRMNRMLATVSTAIRGGDLLLRSINNLCLKRNMQFITQGPADEMLAFSVVAVGIYAQLLGPRSTLFTRLLLFPLTLSENLLMLWVAA